MVQIFQWSCLSRKENSLLKWYRGYFYYVPFFFHSILLSSFFLHFHSLLNTLIISDMFYTHNSTSFHIIETYTDHLLICTVTHNIWEFLSNTCSGSWKTMQFKAYNFNSLGMPLQAGHLHPLMKVRKEMRQIFLEMGLALSIFLFIVFVKCSYVQNHLNHISTTIITFLHIYCQVYRNANQQLCWKLFLELWCSLSTSTPSSTWCPWYFLHKRYKQK